MVVLSGVARGATGGRWTWDTLRGVALC